VPSIAAILAKIGAGYSSDKRKELRWHFAVPALAGALGMLLMPWSPHSVVLSMVFLTLATAGVHGCIPVFWSVPGLYLSGVAAAGGLALITTMGNTAGALGPYMLGIIKTRTGSFDDGLYIMAGFLLVATLLILLVVPRKRTKVLKPAEQPIGIQAKTRVLTQPPRGNLCTAVLDINAALPHSRSASRFGADVHDSSNEFR
jgi:nitrate/nitrite transporter NarK